jgi:hypothetical protein
MIHNFNRSLEESRAYAEAPWWEDVYRRAFSGIRSLVYVADDGWAQRGGVDRLITLASGRTITVDEKVRKKDWNDILLERWSDVDRRSPGWVQKPLLCEFIAYAMIPSRKCWLLPTLTLQAAWRRYGRDWIEQYDEVRAINDSGYTTVSVAVPTDILIGALGKVMSVTWQNHPAPRKSAKLRLVPKQWELPV